MPNPPEVVNPQDQISVTARIPSPLVARLDALAARLTAASLLGDQVTRSAVLRRAIELGCEQLEQALEARAEPQVQEK